MSGKLFVLLIIVGSLALIGGGVVFLSQASETAVVQEAPGARLTVTESRFDWGVIKLSGGTVQKRFVISNTGSEVLKLYNVLSSCACTTAQLFSGEKASPVFTMHSKSDYVTEVPVGGQAELAVVFDPAFHGPNGVGPIERVVQLSTNSPETPALTFTVTARVER